MQIYQNLLTIPDYCDSIYYSNSLYARIMQNYLIHHAHPKNEMHSKRRSNNMKKQIAILCVLVILACSLSLLGCSDSTPTKPHKELKSVEQVGEVPQEFKEIIKSNRFREITAFEERLLKAELCSFDKEQKTAVYQIRMMDTFGNDLAAYTCTVNDAYHVITLTATKDGGFLFVLGFEDYAYGQDQWASDHGFASRVIKCDKDGVVQFDTPIDSVEGDALQYCFEQNGQFYFFGQRQNPETKITGTYSSTDIYMTILDGHGQIIKERSIAGSDFDSLDAAEEKVDHFVLSVRSQSDDGDFSGSNSKGHYVDWVITVNHELEITEKKKETGRNYFDHQLGERDGAAVYRSDPILKDFDAGTAEALVCYDDFYLIISENATGVYENTPSFISSIWYYTETVYSAYDYNGNLIFRASVDSSPDYDAYESTKK